MTDEQLWALGCSNCGKEIKMPVSWFKAGNNCPHCSHPVDPGRIDKMLNDIKNNLTSIEGDDDIEFNF